jgi:CO/xanthine dehydrogenase Mo-binding subunit
LEQKGLAKGRPIQSAAAVANAIYNAIGVRIKDMPISMEKVLKALREKKASSGK